jgi:DNA replication initiation complex subunit (GINS family)
VVNSRLKKIVSLASAPPQTEQILKNFTSEERVIYERLHKLVCEWRAQILGYKEA